VGATWAEDCCYERCVNYLISKKCLFFNIKNAGKSHCADMSVHMPDDPPEVLRARKVIQEEIDKWLA
jgi:hypothetical protein